MANAVDVPSISFDNPNTNDWLHLTSVTTTLGYDVYQYCASNINGIKVVGFLNPVWPDSSVVTAIGLLYYSDMSFTANSINWAAFHGNEYAERGVYSDFNVVHTNYYYGIAYNGVSRNHYGGSIVRHIYCYDTLDEALTGEGIIPYGVYPITYRPTNCSFPNAPTEAQVGSTVVVPVAFPNGYGLVNESNIYVTNNRVAIPSTYYNGQLTFTMPNPT